MVVAALVLFVLPASTESANSLILDFASESMVDAGGHFWLRANIFLTKNMPVIAIGFCGLLALIVAIYLSLRVTERGRAVLDRVKLRSPLFGKCYRLSLLSRLCETLGLLIQANVPVGDALYLAGQCSPSATIRGTCTRVQGAVEGGRSLSDAMSSEPILGPMLTFMVSIGEKREAPHEELHRAAELFASNLNNRARRVALWIDGIVLVLVALLIVFFTRLIFQPLLMLIRTMGASI